MDDMVWLETLYQENFKLLYHVGRMFAGAGPAMSGLVEDEIHEVFMLAWSKREKLKSHVNIEGWLVEAMRKRMLACYRKWHREQKHLSFSLNEENAAEPSDKNQEEGFQQAAQAECRDNLNRLLGKEDAELFQLYCVQRMPAREVADRFCLTEAGLRMRASRIRKKVLLHKELFLATILFLVLRY